MKLLSQLTHLLLMVGPLVPHTLVPMGFAKSHATPGSYHDVHRWPKRLPNDRVAGQDRRMEMPETLNAGPIRLQRWTVDRASDMNKAIRESLPKLMPFLPWASMNYDVDDALGYLGRSHNEWETGENFNYAMLSPGGDGDVEDDGEIVGCCGLMSRQGPNVLEIGYWVHSAHAGKGYATAAASALAEAGLARPGIDRIEIHHDLDNPASGRVAAKAGFHELGPLEAKKGASGDSGMHLVWIRRTARSGGELS